MDRTPPLLFLVCTMAALGCADAPPPKDQVLWSATFDHDGDFTGLQEAHQDVSDLVVAGGRLYGRVSGPHPMLSTNPVNVYAAKVRAIDVRMRVSAGKEASIFFTTDTFPRWTPLQRCTARIPPVGWNVLRFDPRLLPLFRGKVRALRIDPTDAPGAIFEIDAISILG